jgi:Plasmid pRiA4b ORF-3-like protein
VDLSGSLDHQADSAATGLVLQARDCVVMQRAHRLARWIGGKGRSVTAGQVLRQSDVAAAGAVLSFDVQARVRTAADVPALHRPWCVAVASGLLTIGGGMVSAGAALESWPSAADRDVLAGWLAGLKAVCEAESDRRFPESVSILVLVLLEILSLDDPPAGRDHRWVRVRSRIIDEDDFYEGFYDRTFDRYVDLDTGDPLGGLFVLLNLFGAVTGGSSEARITPLGRWALVRLRAGLPDPVGPELSAAELIDLLAACGGDADKEWERAQPWLETRTPDAAARELLAAAAAVPASLRVVAVEVVDMLDKSALPVWRDLVDEATIGPHARAVLATWGEQDATVAVRVEDRPWLVVEAAAAALAGPGPDEALTLVYEAMPGSDGGSRIEAVRASGHPEAEAVMRALTAFVASGQPRTIDRVHQLKVTLLGWRPPIWRRVLVPSVATLGELHRVVQVLFGWDGDHLHVFDAGARRYSDPFWNLEETRDEFSTRIASVLPAPKRKVIYTYDLGAGWRHEIALEKVVDRAPRRDYPFCVAFGGDSPVEYPSEDEPEESTPFDPVSVNCRLVAVRGDE